jgi:hypothetical protein
VAEAVMTVSVMRASREGGVTVKGASWGG